MKTTVFILCLLIITVLAIIAGVMHFKLFKQRKRLEAYQQEQENILAEKNNQLESDVRFLARAYLAKQVELNEASLRIRHLLDKANLAPEQRQKFITFDEVARQIENIPTHEQWKSLSKAERKNHRETFKALENEYKAEAEAAAKYLARHGLEKISSSLSVH